MTERAADIAALGVTHVWLPPPSQSVSPEGYLPGRGVAAVMDRVHFHVIHHITHRFTD